MTKKKIYKVSFKGVIFPGFDKEQVIDNVHDITRIPKQTISRKFFSGKTVVIRHADSQEYASRLQKTFAQAGIETYISELTETIADEKQVEPEELSETVDTKEVTSSSIPSEKTQTSIVPKIAAGLAVIVIISIVAYLMIDVEPSAVLNKEPSAALHKKPSTPQESAKSSLPTTPVVPETSITTLPSFLAKDKIIGLIKLTDKSEFKQLLPFMKLLAINTTYHDVIKQKVSAKDSVFIISKEKPLYLFKTSKFSGIILNTKNKLPQTLLSSYKTAFKKQYQDRDSGICEKNTFDVQIVTTETQLLMTSHKAALESIPDLKTLEALFQYTEHSKTSFSFFYKNPAPLLQDNELGKRYYLTLFSNNKETYLSPDPTFYKNNIALFNQLDITSNNDTNKVLNTHLSLDKSLSLVQLIISQMYPRDFLLNSQSSILFQQQQIAKINKSNSADNLKPYQNNLDLELLPQWQSGPFAITTNQFIFNNNLVLELLAKGQNINNLMEYSNSAYLQTDKVLNHQGENILKNNCADTGSSLSYFQDVDGEQEAYVNDDFLAYQTVTAKAQVPIKAGYNNTDISKIEGKIVLQLPLKIKQKELKVVDNSHYSQFNQFSILLKNIPETNSLEYTVTGQLKHFITLRAYNYAGDVIDSISLLKKLLVNSSSIVYSQTFSEPVEVIKLFYSKENTVINYPFTFKPEIILTNSSLLVNNERQDIQPIAYKNEGFKPITDVLKNDNPAWLGQKIPENKLLQNLSSPFYISVFLQNNSEDPKNIDAVLNIKSNLTPFISQNMTAVKVSLKTGKDILLDNFVSFNTSEFIENEEHINQSKQLNPPKIFLYHNNNTAFELTTSNNQLNGSITLSLPKSFKSHSTPYSSLGQTIKLDGIFIKSIQQDKHQIQFEIKGDIKNLVQLRLYNQKKELISELFEFKHLKKNNALITLLYYGKIDLIDLILAQDPEIKTYPFNFHMK